MDRFRERALPKNREEEAKKHTPGMRIYEPYDRIQKMTQLQSFDDYLTYRASEQDVGESYLNENPYSIAPNALKMHATARTKELAEPKDYHNAHVREHAYIRENPYAISPAALKAKASPRVIELAQPKGK